VAASAAEIPRRAPPLEALPLPIIFEAVDSLQHPGDSLQHFLSWGISTILNSVLRQFSSWTLAISLDMINREFATRLFFYTEQTRECCDIKALHNLLIIFVVYYRQRSQLIT
jgi:hypothetical protein